MSEINITNKIGALLIMWDKSTATYIQLRISCTAKCINGYGMHKINHTLSHYNKKKRF